MHKVKTMVNKFIISQMLDERMIDKVFELVVSEGKQREGSQWPLVTTVQTL